jgi:CheY-like chemotaxis protein/glycine cleavage system H lipoate-binding protein
MPSKGNILVVDDEQVILNAVKKICCAEDYYVDESPDAKDALNKLEKRKYDLVLCDIMMPEIDGFKFLDEIRHKKIESPVIMTTGYSTVENAVNSLYKGAIDFIPKPFTADELLTSLSRGMKYLEIQNNIRENEKLNRNSTLIYVPCPAKYYRLGYATWVSLETKGTAIIGITDLFLKTIESVSDIQFMGIDEEIIQGISCLQIISMDGQMHQVLASVSGRIIEINEELLNNKTIVEKDPYFNGWLYRIIPNDIDYELKHLTPCSSDRF